MLRTSQQASLNALLGLFLAAEGQALPEHTPVKSARSLRRVLNRYTWSTRRVIQTMRRASLQPIGWPPPPPSLPVRILMDWTPLEQPGKFWPLRTPTAAPEASAPWVRRLQGQRGLHLVVLSLVVGAWRVPWSFRVWRGKGHPRPVQGACPLLATVPQSRLRGSVVLGQAETALGTIACLQSVHRRAGRPMVGRRSHRKLPNGRCLKDLYRRVPRGLQVVLEGLD